MAICLNMIVKNEAQNLERLFASVYRYIDYYVIADTGSTDETIPMIHALGKLYGIPGEVVSHNWQDFATNRQLALEAALDAREAGRHDCYHLLFLDADDELVVIDKQWKDQLHPGTSYTAYRKLGGIAFRRILLAWIDNGLWRWKGEIHENLQRGNQGQETPFLTTVYVRCHELQGYNFRRFGNASDRTQNDLILLEKEMKAAVPEKRTAHRLFQYALALRDAKQWEKAMDVFQRILSERTIGGSFRYMSMVQTARILLQTGKEIDKAIGLLQQAISEHPERGEAYYYRSVAQGMQGHYDKALESLDLGLGIRGTSAGGYAYTEEDIINWKLAYERCLLLYRLGRTGELMTASEKLLELSELPDVEYRFIASLRARVAASQKQDTLDVE